MLIRINQPIGFSHVGQRTNNQDTLCPAIDEIGTDDSLFVVCDGMGGADKGEVASRLLCDAIAGYAASMDYPVLDAVHLKTALDRAYDSYHAYLGQYPLVNRMGSTLALMQLHQHGVTLAHIGDSRVYQVRGGRVIFQTQDHRQVNDMVEAGIITAEQARTHPWRNRLSRAVVAQSTPDHVSTRPSPDSVLLTDVQTGDYFFMCTDGVMEQIDTPTLETLLGNDEPDATKMDRLQAICSRQTKDNYSGYLISIQCVENSFGQPIRATDTAISYAV